MARLTAIGFVGSVALHGVAYASLGFAPKRGAEGRAPVSVMFEMEAAQPELTDPEPEPVPPAEPEPREAPVAPAQPSVAPRPLAPAAPKPATTSPPAPKPAVAPVDLSGLTLTNGVGEGGWAPMGDGSTRSGPIGPIGPSEKRAVASTTQATKPVVTRTAASEPALVSSRDLSERPRPPALEAALKAYYPAEARLRAISGSATLRVRIEPNGRVKSASILNESFGGFGAACQKALLSSVWSPPRDRDGRAVATEVRYTCRFVVE